MTDEEKIMQYLQRHQPTICPPASAYGLSSHTAVKPSEMILPDTRVLQSNEQRLAQALLAEMFQSLAGFGFSIRYPGTKAKLNNDSRLWFFSRNKNFVDLCDAAGYDPDYVRARARKILKDGLPSLPKEPTHRKPRKRKLKPCC